MTNEFFILIAVASEKLKLVDPNHNPIKGHTIDTAKAGASVFDNDFKDVETLGEKMLAYENAGMIKDLAVTPGKYGALCITYCLSDDITIGMTCKSTPVKGELYTIVKDHGDLIPSGKVEAKMVRTNKITFVLTPEKTSDYAKEYVLASVYPGVPDEDGDWRNIKEGDQVTAEELIARHIMRVKTI